jgi:3-hydroxyisobutyrate dehydrogenase
MTKIAFIGLGHMGLPMALNCLKAGFEVCGYDLQTPALDAFEKGGGKRANSLTAVVDNADIAITMLQSGAQVKAVIDGRDGLYAHLRKGSLHIDCSTIDVTSARAVHSLAAKHDIHSLDAPVSGGVAGATIASLTFMIGGLEQHFNQAKPVFEAMGKTLIYTGIAGNGQAAKICNNMLLGISMIGVSEAFVLAEKLGLEAKTLHDVLSNASGQCWVTDRYVPVPNVLDNVPANNAYQAGFAAAMMLKDLRLSQECAQSEQLELPMAKQAQTLYENFAAQGNDDLDFSAIIKTITH